MTAMPGRPADTEYAPFYAGYVAHVPEDDVMAVLRAQPGELAALTGAVTAEREGFAYATGKWTVREVMGHLGDAERVFGYRAFRFGRGDQTPLASFDENLFVANGRFDATPLHVLLDEFVYLRLANLAALARLDAAGWHATGTASGALVSVRALAFMMAGHVRHHVRILRERYGLSG